MKTKHLLSLSSLLLALNSFAQSEVMLQGFYWDSYIDTQWTNLEKQADELSTYFNYIWVPQSGNCNSSGNVMGYMPVYYFDHNSSFGSEAQLRSMIKTYKEKGTGIIADVVVNHRNTIGWFGFPSETYKGTTYQMLSTDICRNDDGGKSLTEANRQGVSLSPNNDTGDGWDGCRDLDHKSANVNKSIKAYLDYLLNDLGYTGFRYDMVKGFTASFVGDYNSTANPAFSVGEYWDGTGSIKNWINGTSVNGKPQSKAFDFQFRYRVRDAVNGGDWRKLSAASENNDGQPLVFDANYKQYAVTFVENHDTQYRSPSDPLDPIKKDTLAANAYMLAMPGTPCVFLPHWKAYKKELKLMIEARKLVGITDVSTYTNHTNVQACHANIVQGTKGKLLVSVGKTPTLNLPASGYVQLLSGKGYCYLVSADTDLSSWQETVARIEDEEAAEPFTPHTATIYVRNENNWTKTNFYIWDSNNNSQLNGGWPGKTIADTKDVAGYTWHCQTFTIPAADYYFNAVFSAGSGSPQTVDVTLINEDRYFVITTSQSGGKYLVTDVTAEVESASISAPTIDAHSDSPLYDLTGRRVTSPLPRHIYIQNNKKTIFK